MPGTKDLIRKVFNSSVKSCNDEELTIEHFISTEQRDRSKDIMRANGMVMDGVPVVLKQHGFDPDTGNEPIAKPISITVGTDENGNNGILVKTKYYDGSSLVPPDNTGRRLYEKAKENFMPYWSIGFRGLETKPLSGGGTDYAKWLLYEYSQVGVPDNVGAKVIKSLEDAEKFIEEKENDLYKFEIKKKEKSLQFKDIKKVDENPDEESEEQRLKMAIAIVAEVNGISVEDVEKALQAPEFLKLKSIAERVAEELPYNAIRTIHWAFIDELYYCDGQDKSVRAILKEYLNMITPFAVSFAQATTENPEEFTEIKTLIKIKLSLDNKDSIDDPAPIETVKEIQPTGNPNTLKLRKSPTLKLQSSPVKKTFKLGMSKEDLKNSFKDIMKKEMKAGIDKLKGVVE